MNRTVKFRGRQIDTGEWKYGYYRQFWCCNNGTTHIISDDCGSTWEVIPETVSEFTGLTDMKGKEIYEGDIVASVLPRDGQIISVGDVQFDCGVFGIEWIEKKNSTMFGGWGQRHRIEVIGNIHEHKHLLDELPAEANLKS
jgi:uncharacterized phage protein (TIGR01671 family)